MKSFHKGLSIIFLLTVTVSALWGQTKWTRIKYISGKTIYIGAGKRDGLQVGDSVRVYHNRKFVALLQVEFVASHSASCKILQSLRALAPGYPVKFHPHLPSKTQRPPVKKPPTQPRTALPPHPQTKPATRIKNDTPIRIRGGMDIQYYYSRSTTGTGFTYARPSARLKLTASHLPGDHQIRIYFRSYQVHRLQSVSSLPGVETRYRLYAFSLEHSRETHRWQYQLGRIHAYPISGLGYLDGALVATRIFSNFRIGIFGGTEPHWETFAFQRNAPKYGVFVRYHHQQSQLRFSTSAALITSSISGIENRTYWYTRQTFQWHNNLYINASFEMDINRGWRRERSGHAVSLSNIFLLAQYRLPGGHAISLSYDNRRNYWTYFYRTFSDSLFDTRIRQGLRFNLSVRLPWQLYVNGYLNANIRQGEQRSALGAGMNILKRQLILRSAAGGLQVHAFRDIFTTGGSGQLWSQITFFSRVYTRMALGYRYYSLGGNIRQNRWIRTEIDWQLFSRLGLSTILEFHSGDDFAGTQQFMELHYTF